MVVVVGTQPWGVEEGEGNLYSLDSAPDARVCVLCIARVTVCASKGGGIRATEGLVWGAWGGWVW